MAILLFGLWILLSGEITVKVCLTGAAVSAAVYALACKALQYDPAVEWRAVKKVGRGIAYIFYLLGEILKAGFVVMKLIYTKGRNMEPRMIYFHTGLMSDSARAALSDAITLTAGTITVSQEGDLLCVHTLDKSLAEGLERSAFEQKLTKLEMDV